MTKRIISNCFQCESHCPNDSYGATHICTYESNEGKLITGDYENEIPDWCPLPLYKEEKK